MNKKFFSGMKSFAVVLLVIGVCGSILMLFILSVSEVSTGLYTTEKVFNPTGFASGIACLFGSIAGYYLLKGVALIGLRAYEDEPEVKPDNKQTASYGKDFEDFKAGNPRVPHDRLK